MLNQVLLRQIAEVFVSRTNPAPIKLPEFNVIATAEVPALPDPGLFRRCIVSVNDKGCVGYSNGVAWVRADGTVL